MPRIGIKFRAPPVAVRLHQAEFEYIVNLAEAKALSVSDIVRMAVVEFREHHEGAPA